MFDQILDAQQRLNGVANVTPVMQSRMLNSELNAEIFFKCENFQRIGAFKFRGAYNAISQLSDEEKARGVITYSSGNHAQAVALVGKLLNLKTTIVMPKDASQSKLAATKGYGANVVEIDPQKTTREAEARKIQAREGQVMIPPFDHANIVAGQGTAALELLQEVGNLDRILVPCGGGGLLSGSAIAARGQSPDCRVIGIEPEIADDATRSFQSGTLQTVDNPPTIADGTRTTSLGKVTFPLVLEYAAGMCTVSEESIIDAVRYLFNRLKIVVEPSGVLGLAALMSGAVKPAGRIGIILSGGNVDPDVMARILAS